MAYTDYIAPRKSIYELNWTVQPRWLLSWGLRQLGLRKPSINAGTLPQGRFVLLRNVEVCSLSGL